MPLGPRLLRNVIALNLATGWFHNLARDLDRDLDLLQARLLGLECSG